MKFGLYCLLVPDEKIRGLFGKFVDTSCLSFTKSRKRLTFATAIGFGHTCA